MGAEIVRTPELTAEQWQMVRDTLANGASERDFVPLMEMAKARRLNPLLRQIHFVERWDGIKGRKVWSVQVSIDGLRAIAERTGLYAGQDEPEFVDGPEGPTGLPVACKVRVYRKDWTRPAVGIAYWAEAVQVSRDKTTGKERPSAMWARMPRLMLAKVAEALALRKAFPEDTSGLYTGDEIQEASESAEEARRLPAPSVRALAAPPARSLPPLEALGIEAAPAMPEIDLGATQPLTEREVPGLLAEIASASSEAELREVWEVAKPSVDLSGDSTRRTIARAINARRRELTPPPDGTSGPQGSGTSTGAEGTAAEGAPTAMDARAYLGGIDNRRALENAVRKHGRAQGRAWLTLAAQRLVAISTPADDGTRLALVCATQAVEVWAHEGPRRKRAA